MRAIVKIPYISSIFATSTFRQSTITFAGTVLNGALGAIFYILAARFLGPSSFGLMGVAIATLTLFSDVGNLGTDTGLVNFVPRYKDQEPEKAERFLKLGFKVKLLVGIVSLVLGLMIAPILADKVFGKPVLQEPLRIAFIGVGALILFSFVTSILQAYQRFWTWSVIQVVTNALRVVLVLGLFFWGALTLSNTLWLYIVIPLFGFIAGILIISPKFLKVRNEFSVAKEFFHYNKWVALFTVFSALGGRLDTFISARLLDSRDLGFYAAANQLVKIVPMIVGALGTVIAPKMASMGGISELKEYLKKTQLLVLGLAMLGIFSIPIVTFLIPHLYGVEYISTTTLFVVLLLAMLVFLVSVPIHMAVFYYFSKPSFFVWISLGQLLIVGLAGWNLISNFGTMGAVTTVLIGQIFSFVVPAVWVLRKVK